MGRAAGIGLLGSWRRAPYLLYVGAWQIVWGFMLKSGISTSAGRRRRGRHRFRWRPRKTLGGPACWRSWKAFALMAAFLILLLFA